MSRKFRSLADRITTDPATLGGMPCIARTRLGVHCILGRLAGGETVEDLLKERKYLEPDDIRAVFSFASKLVEEKFGEKK